MAPWNRPLEEEYHEIYSEPVPSFGTAGGQCKNPGLSYRQCRNPGVAGWTDVWPAQNTGPIRGNRAISRVQAMSARWLS